MLIRVLLAEDLHLVRGALGALLALESDIEVVASVKRGDAILPAAVEHKPDVAVIDINLPGLDGLSAAALVNERMPGTGTLILDNVGRPATLRRAMAARVSGYLLKDAPPEELAGTIRKIASGHRVIDPELALAAWDSSDTPLTTRESEVLTLAAGGHGAGDIAARLRLAPGTVRNYLAAAVGKLQARNRVDAIRIARESGWIL
ncbi:DNA-binding response regulator [Streptomyces sp. Da 82-17]|uniref:response regulator transcription factor n=1 Tax=Streptomyces sp. Da 82-17 TaxID=3377116 RepID=UPI0038D3C652